jgi:hypothetical protein
VTRPGSVIPAEAGIHFDLRLRGKMDPGFRRDDERETDGKFELTKHATNG